MTHPLVPLTLDQLDRLVDYDDPVKVFDIPPGHDAITMEPDAVGLIPFRLIRATPDKRRICIKFFNWADEVIGAAYLMQERIVGVGNELMSLTIYRLPDGRAALLAFVIPPCPSLGSTGRLSG
jgi:hypothetical protein